MSGKLILRKRFVVTLVFLVVFLAAIYPLAILWHDLTYVSPRRLTTGDVWNYKVAFPDAKSYELTVSVRDIVDLNGTDAYVILYDDTQHLSTEYLWITLDWYEVRTFRPAVGNIIANSTTTYSPPVQLFHVPFHSGDRWIVNSTLHTVTRVKNTTLTSTELLLEVRTTSPIEDISTPAGRFHAYKVTVTREGRLSETLWFDAGLGEVVYGEFYNDNEKVTQMLTSFSSPSSVSGAVSAFPRMGLDAWLFQQYPCRETFASYIYLLPASFTHGAEDML
jgi:hypothetical protein